MFQIPHNTALEGLSEGMLEAWKIYNVPKYGNIKANANRQNIESIFEKTFSGLSSSLWLRARGRCTMSVTRSSTSLRSANRTLTVTWWGKTWLRLSEQGKLVGDDSRLFVDGQEVAVVYFRCGYVIHNGNVNLYIRQAKFDTQIPEFDTQIPKFDTQNFKIRHPNSRIRHLNSTGVKISSVVEYIDLRSHCEAPFVVRAWMLNLPGLYMRFSRVTFCLDNYKAPFIKRCLLLRTLEKECEVCHKRQCRICCWISVALILR